MTTAKEIPGPITAKNAERFWKKVDKRGPDECWPWLASTSGHSKKYPNKEPRGGIRINKRRIPATRAGWFIHYGFDPYPLHVLHTCDNGLCCNPAHWFRGTNKENILDRNLKGRGGRKINADIVRTIRARLHDGESQQSIADSLGINQTLVSAIVRGVVWNHVSD